MCVCARACACACACARACVCVRAVRACSACVRVCVCMCASRSGKKNIRNIPSSSIIHFHPFSPTFSMNIAMFFPSPFGPACGTRPGASGCSRLAPRAWTWPRHPRLRGPRSTANQLPSGKCLHSYGKSPFSMGKYQLMGLKQCHKPRMTGNSLYTFIPPIYGDDWGIVPSGKRLHSYGKSQFLMGKSTLNGHVQ